MPTDDQLTEALEGFRAANPGTEIDPERAAAMLRAIWTDAITTAPPEMG